MWQVAGPWAGLVAGAVWTATFHPGWLAVSAALLVGSLVAPGARDPEGRLALLGGAGLALALAVVPLGFLAHRSVERVQASWPAYWEAREEAVFAELTGALEELVDRGDRTADLLAEAVAEGAAVPPPARLRELRTQGGFPAAAVYDAAGDLVVWEGRHQGRVPEEAQFGRAPYLHGERPLFSYLYFTRPLPPTGPVPGGTVMVAGLLRTDLPPGLRADLGDLASRLSHLTGESIRISRAERVADEPAFDFVWRGGAGPDTLFSVTVAEPAPSERARSRGTAWITGITGVLLAAWVLLTLAVRGRRTRAGWAAGTLVALAVLLPLDRMLRDAPLFDVAGFLLPVPGALSLGRLLAVVLAVVASSVLLRRLLRPRIPAPLAALPVLLGFPLGALLLRRSASPGLLAGADSVWIPFQLALALLLTGFAAWTLGLGRARGSRSSGGGPHLVAAGTLAAALGAGAGVLVWLGGHLPGWLLGAWAVPAVVALPGLQERTGWRRSLAVWGLAGIVGISAALPEAWGARVEARKAVAEVRLERLGAPVDPYLDFLLHRLGRTAQALDASGAGPVELLYRSWVDSGLAREGYAVWLTLWGSGDLPLEDLQVGVAQERPVVASELLDRARLGDTVLVRRYALRDAHYVATVPLAAGQVLTAVIPPVRELDTASPLAPLFGTEEAGAGTLTLVPLLEGDAPAGPREEVRWARTEAGWRGETLLEFPGEAVPGQGVPGERFRAYYVLEVTGAPVLGARAVLLLVLDLGVLLAIWLLGRAVFLGPARTGTRWGPFLTSFRARVTGALFGFFLLSNAIFGTLAYRTLAAAAERTTRVLAERVASDAAAIYPEEGQGMELLGLRVGTDLLEYRGGELREGSSEELVELGLYQGWLPYDVWRSLTSGEALLTTRETSLGRWAWVTAYRRLLDADILGAPIPLQAGATAVRRQEVAHLLAFAVVAGGALSFLLALLVGRTLTRPIRTLQVASERVGGGNLEVRLPSRRTDEFGDVFSAFNRMVRRLRQARRDLVRTTRRTQAIVEEAATGVVALDPAGRVTLANARAAELLDREIEVGRRLRSTGAPADELVRWVQLYFRDGLQEAGSEFQFGERRLRVRARRISRDGPPGGAVVSLEDVTDELRAERVLAWGQMARQVAHEVKNPLTPIKLSLQHIRRAWDDRRPDFEPILHRNAEAALREIDRLAAIASSFSRFGAPEAAAGAPLRPVELDAVVREVLALYDTGEGAIRFEMQVEAGLPPVAARETEVKEVLVNLLENARAAVETRGLVRVEARGMLDGVALRVEDDGSGIPEELLPRIFEPHFSTRSAGTGLGLAIVRRVVDSWGARVSVASEAGEGTTVEIVLTPWPDHVRMSREEGDEGGPGGGV